MTESTDELPLKDLQREISELILDSPAPGKHAARFAVRHLKRAWLIREQDPEMAAFRAITAEEEAARALFEALRRRGYPGANRLNWRIHQHKAAVAPFFEIVRRFIAAVPMLPSLQLVLDRTVEPLRLELGIRVPWPDGSEKLARPIPPLNYTLSANDQIHDFGPEIEKFAQDQNVKEIGKHIDRRANLRNQLLYATNEGIPNLGSPIEPFMFGRRDMVFQMLVVYVMIDPYPEHQLFVVQCLDAFLDILPRLSRGKARERDRSGA